VAGVEMTWGIIVPPVKSPIPADDPDRGAITRVKRGDVDAFDELVRRYEHRIVNFIRTQVSRAVDPEDVAQEVFLRAFRGLKTFRADSSFKTWLYQIATNTARTHGERASRRKEDAAGTLGDDGPDGPPPARSDEDLEAQIVLRDRLDRALATLPDEQRQVVVLRDVEGFDYREIAELVGVPMGTVESRLFRARARLRSLLRPGTDRMED
jgi:RNA polymerase sigma-70 factor (ECF subfamily)